MNLKKLITLFIYSSLIVNNQSNSQVLFVNKSDSINKEKKSKKDSLNLTTPKIIYQWEATGNPIVTHKYTCDPAALVYHDTLFIFTGQDAAGNQTGYNIKNWCCFATTDMQHFIEYKIPLKAEDFKWNWGKYAYAGQVIERNGKFYWYVSTNTTGIGVAVADRPEGPYKDVLGQPMLTNADSKGQTNSWRTIDPTVFIDDDGQAWLYWGNRACWCVKLDRDMISYDKDYGVRKVDITGNMKFSYTEAPWIHKYKKRYYLSFAAGFPERIEYAISDRPEGPFEYKGILNEIAGNSNTNHQAIIQYKKKWYFIYHTGGMQTQGGSGSRSICIDKLELNREKLYKPVMMTTSGVEKL
jgi:beta-xylosidase